MCVRVLCLDSVANQLPDNSARNASTLQCFSIHPSLPYTRRYYISMALPNAMRHQGGHSHHEWINFPPFFPSSPWSVYSSFALKLHNIARISTSLLSLCFLSSFFSQLVSIILEPNIDYERMLYCFLLTWTCRFYGRVYECVRSLCAFFLFVKEMKTWWVCRFMYGEHYPGQANDNDWKEQHIESKQWTCEYNAIFVWWNNV